MAKKPKRQPPKSLSELAANPMGAVPLVLSVLGKYGIPTVGLAVLLWLVLGEQRTTLNNIDSRVGSQAQSIAELLKHLESEREQAWIQLGVMQRICLNTAKTDADRISCAVSMPRR